MMLATVVFVPLLLMVSSTEGSIKVVATPVVFTNNRGGGLDELEVLPTSGTSKLFDAGGRVLAAWWVPYDNIGDLSAIHTIQATPDGNKVKLSVFGQQNQATARVRLMLYAQIDDNDYEWKNLR